MQLSAVLVVGNSLETATHKGSVSTSSQRKPGESVIACADILGQSVLVRTVRQLSQAGVALITVIAASDVAENLGVERSPRFELRKVAADMDEGRVAAEVIEEHGGQHAESVLVYSLDAYTEFDVVELLRFHLSRKKPLTRAKDENGPLGLWIVDALSVRRNDVKNIFLRGEDRENDPRVASFLLKGYVRRLRSAQDVRRLTIDGLLGRCGFAPCGREERPGVWLGEGARVHPAARLVAPVFIGRSTKVGSGALVTRFSSVEQRCLVDAGATIEDASILPDTYVGRGIDVAHAVVDGNHFVHLKRDVAVDVEDASLIGSRRPKVRTAKEKEQGVGALSTGIFGLGYSRYLLRTAGLISEVFKG